MKVGRFLFLPEIQDFFKKNKKIASSVEIIIT
jgi:hypothetical protein